MSKIAIIGDMHFGIKGGNQAFLEFQMWWLEQALKRMQEMGITRIIQTGDMFDVRQYTKTNVLMAIVHRLPSLLKKYGIDEWITYGGNHEMFYRDSNDCCTLDILKLLSDDDLVFWVYADEVGLWNNVAFVPWLNKNNHDRLLKSIPAGIEYVFGHFEMVGMPMVPGGASCEHGLEVKSFNKYKRVISGHFHTASNSLNCTMVGSPYHLNWGDTLDGTNRGFWTLDLETDELELHKNEEHMTLFSVLQYDPEETYNEQFLEPYKGTMVKVLVNSKPEAKHYKKFSDLLAKAELIDYKIIDKTMTEIEKVSISEEVLSLDTLSAINAFIDGQGDEVDKDAIKKLAKDTYMEAMNNGV